MANKGFLLVLMQPPPSLEDEFNAWYDTEHIPERAAVPGFLTALRYVCISGHPRYLAMYDLETFSVLDSAAYKRVGYENASPWTKRVTSRVRIYRSAGEQIYPGQAITQRSARIELLRFRHLAKGDASAIVAGLEKLTSARKEISQLRVLAFDTPEGIDYLGVIETTAPLSSPLDLASLGSHARAIDLVNSYAPY